MRRGIRARPIDPFRRMPITAESGLVYDEEEEGAEGAVKKNIVVDLPIPEITEVATYEKEHAPDFVLPLAFIKFPIRLDEVDDNEPEYDLDHDDEARGSHRVRVGVF